VVGDGALRREGDVGAGDIDTAQPGGLKEGVEDRRDLGTPLGLRSVVVLPADHNASQGTLGGVVVDRDSRSVEEDRQPLPQLEHVRDGPTVFGARL